MGFRGSKSMRSPYQVDESRFLIYCQESENRGCRLQQALSVKKNKPIIFIPMCGRCYPEKALARYPSFEVNASCKCTTNLFPEYITGCPSAWNDDNYYRSGLSRNYHRSVARAHVRLRGVGGKRPKIIKASAGHSPLEDVFFLFL